ncbi:carbon monoxide dehydrogenase subunit G [Ochrobactrum sp. CM-21-5]|nr:carbon monoxide dehydrogenase subunit G [Ochrobactrum sp. CM-21-5]MBC2884398.1 carbon monoxide dehydrogenase subunit G [Ochrobactrum sp. CM-21-5]
MDLTGEERIAAPRQAVWDALNDIETLKSCIPGCEDLERISQTEIRAALKVSLGVLKVRFHGMLELSNMNPPASYTISGRGEGSIAGFAHGVTDVRLDEDNDETILSYAIRGDAGGKIAQFGTKLLGSVARKIADRFFASIADAAAQNAASDAATKTA